MVVYTCKRCNIEFDKKSNYLNHLKRKKPCKEKVIEILQVPVESIKIVEQLHQNPSKLLFTISSAKFTTQQLFL